MWNNGSEFGNNMTYVYDFNKHDTLLSSDFTYITRHTVYDLCCMNVPRIAV